MPKTIPMLDMAAEFLNAMPLKGAEPVNDEEETATQKALRDEAERMAATGGVNLNTAEMTHQQQIQLLTRKDFCPRHLELCKVVLQELSNLFKDRTSLHFEKWVEMCEAVVDAKYKPEGSEFATSETRVMVYNQEAFGQMLPPDEDPALQFESEETKKAAREEYFKRLNSIKRVRTFSVKCFKPSVCFSQIMKQNVRSLILASGTLSPMDMYEDDLGMKFEVKLQNKHVIEPE